MHWRRAIAKDGRGTVELNDPRSIHDWLKRFAASWRHRAQRVASHGRPPTANSRRLNFKIVLAELLPERLDDHVGARIVDAKTAVEWLLRPIRIAGKVAIAGGQDNIVGAIAIVEGLANSVAFKANTA